jgi:hypothetical protein
MIAVFKISPVAAAATMGITILALSLAGISKANADEVSAANLLLKSTHIKTESTNVHFGSLTPAFTPTTVRCRQHTRCTVRIEVSAQFANIQQPDVAAAVVRVDNSEGGVLPNSVLGLDTAGTTPGASTARTFTWMKKGLTTGEHTVTIDFFTSTGGAADSPNRTLTIEVYNQSDEDE